VFLATELHLIGGGKRVGWGGGRATAADLHVEGSCDPCPWAERDGGVWEGWWELATCRAHVVILLEPREGVGNQ
jgi:hypothetical protein